VRNPITALATAAAIAASATAMVKPAQAGCWDCWWVVPGTSHAFAYGSIYGPHFAYPAYSEYGFGYYPYPPFNPYAGPYVVVHHHRHDWAHHE
jgi:hypothetical protein